MLEPGPDEPLCVGAEEGRVLKVHQKQLMSLEDALVGFIQTGHATVEQLKLKLQKKLFAYTPGGGWGGKRQIRGYGWYDERVYGKWGTFGARDRAREERLASDEDIEKIERKKAAAVEWNPPYLVARTIKY